MEYYDGPDSEEEDEGAEVAITTGVLLVVDFIESWVCVYGHASPSDCWTPSLLHLLLMWFTFVCTCGVFHVGMTCGQRCGGHSPPPPAFPINHPLQHPCTPSFPVALDACLKTHAHPLTPLPGYTSALPLAVHPPAPPPHAGCALGWPCSHWGNHPAPHPTPWSLRGACGSVCGGPSWCSSTVRPSPHCPPLLKPRRVPLLAGSDALHCVARPVACAGREAADPAARGSHEGPTAQPTGTRRRVHGGCATMPRTTCVS